MNMPTETHEHLPGAELNMSRMPGHWLLARMGKRVLRPGGLPLTRSMLETLDIQPTDTVVEFAPGLGVTARFALQRHPASYIGVERDKAAAGVVRNHLTGPDQRCIVGRAEDTGLPAATATVMYGEAMLTMHTPSQKAAIIREAYRVLQPGGRYGIHELCLVPDTLDATTKETILQQLSQAIHVGARPLTSSEWRALLEAEGFQVQTARTAPMHLLEPQRLVQDEGSGRALKFTWNVLRTPVARQRVLAMRRIFRHYRTHLAAIVLVGVKPE